MINEKQCTITWYVNGTKISYADALAVTGVIDKIEEREKPHRRCSIIWQRSRDE
jgi:hypothetical protein